MKKAEAPVAGEIVVTGSEEETYRMAEELGSSFQGREVVLLFGDLGAGKTAFTKGAGGRLRSQGHPAGHEPFVHPGEHIRGKVPRLSPRSLPPGLGGRDK